MILANFVRMYHVVFISDKRLTQDIACLVSRLLCSVGSTGDPCCSLSLQEYVSVEDL